MRVVSGATFNAKLNLKKWSHIKFCQLSNTLYLRFIKIRVVKKHFYYNPFQNNCIIQHKSLEPLLTQFRLSPILKIIFNWLTEMWICIDHFKISYITNIDIREHIYCSFTWHFTSLALFACHRRSSTLVACAYLNYDEWHSVCFSAHDAMTPSPWNQYQKCIWIFYG